MKRICRFRNDNYHTFGRQLALSLICLATELSAASVSENRAVIDEIVATTRKLFGGRQWVFQGEDELWVTTNKAVASGLPLDVAVNASDEFATLLIFDISLPNDIQDASAANGKKNSTPSYDEIPRHVKGYMEAVDDYFFDRGSVSRRKQPLLLFRFDECSFGSMGPIRDEFDLEDLMFVAGFFDSQPDYYTSYPERIAAWVDPGPNYPKFIWTPWSETNIWATPPYARDCKSKEEVQNAALYPYTNALSRVKARLGGVTWMESNGKGDNSLKLRRTKPALGAEIRCDIQATDPPTYVFFSIKISPVGVFTNDLCWEKSHWAAMNTVEWAIGCYYNALWGRRDCYQPHVKKVIDRKSEEEVEWNPNNRGRPRSPLAPETSRVASNIWEAQILKCTPDALFQKPHWCTNAFDFANPNASRFSTTKVTAVTLAAYSNAIERVRARFLGTNMVVCSSSGTKTPVVITDIRADIVPPVLDLRLDSMPSGEEAMGVEALKAFSKELKNFFTTLPKLGKRPESFFPCFLIDGRQIFVEHLDLSEKQLTGGLFQAGIYWSKGYFNVSDDSPPAIPENSGND